MVSDNKSFFMFPYKGLCKTRDSQGEALAPGI